MLISLNWIRDFVDLPPDIDPRELGERFTRTTAEVEEVKPVNTGAKGLIVARLEAVKRLPDAHNLQLVVLDVGRGNSVQTVTTAPAIHVGSNVVYAPAGASVAALGEIGSAKVAGKESSGMILPGDALGIEMAAHEAVFAPNDQEPGDELPPELFDDWLIEVDNKSLTHRPDLWGHYGIAREIAAIYGLDLKPYPVVPIEELADESLPKVAISIDDPDACRRYSGLVVEGVPTQPAPLWMQLRLGHVGMRPISGLVDLTNYIMADLGQPMHAFDADRVSQIKVAWAKEGDNFRTLDGMERKLTARELMIQCAGQNIALAGVMGGLESEVSEQTTRLLLESANFDPATIRRTAGRLGLRTDASARFEKSLDPAHTALAIQRFVKLAQPMYPDLQITSRLSDCYPRPHEPITVTVNPRHAARTVGRKVRAEEAAKLLTPLGFQLTETNGHWDVRVPSFRATNDVSIEEDVIEEIARCAGYDNIIPLMPRVTMRRFEPNALHELEQRTLEYFTTAHRFVEVQGYLWYDSTWLAQIGVDAGNCVQLNNPAAEGLHQLRRSLMPGLLAVIEKNRFHFPAFSIIEVGGVFEPGTPEDHEFRHVGLAGAKRGKKAESQLYDRLKGAIEGWAWERFGRPVTFAQAGPAANNPWEHPRRTATIAVDHALVGRVSVITLSLRRAMDEHLSAWAVAWAELRLSGLEELPALTEPLGAIPAHPQVEMDFSFLVPAAERYATVADRLGSFASPLLKHIRYVGSYEGERVSQDRRSITVRAVIGNDARTLVEDDANGFRAEFEQYLTECGYETRK
ncbi:MAG: phenylalanine--tRNA ligase subunit beta [Planctomycetes bacterium]|nr:phenylalanine--tRNA ligase subunit beta [Planctomycetota bacterium]